MHAHTWCLQSSSLSGWRIWKLSKSWCPSETNRDIPRNLWLKQEWVSSLASSSYFRKSWAALSELATGALIFYSVKFDVTYFKADSCCQDGVTAADGASISHQLNLFLQFCSVFKITSFHRMVFLCTGISIQKGISWPTSHIRGSKLEL